MKYELELELKFYTYSFTYHVLSPAITKPHLLVSTVDIKCSSLVSASVSRPCRTPRHAGEVQQGGTQCERSKLSIFPRHTQSRIMETWPLRFAALHLYEYLDEVY